MTDTSATIEIDAEVHAHLAAWCRALDVTPDAIVEELLVDLLADYVAPERQLEEISQLPEVVTAKLYKRRNRTRQDYEAEELVIPHDTLVKRLARDRMVVEGGDAGGAIYAQPLAPSIVGPAETTRELCPVHGWVGRHRFEQDGHIHCEVEGEKCAACDGTGSGRIGHDCHSCAGTGVAPTLSDKPQNDVEFNQGKIGPSIRVPSIVNGKRYRPTRSAPRAKTIPLKKITKAGLRQVESELILLGLSDGSIDESLPQRPATRAGCSEVPRPCPFVSCKHHLYLDVNPETGAIKFNFPDKEPEDLPFSCALDEAALGVHTLEALGEKLNVTRERVRQIELKTLTVARALAVEQGLTAEDAQGTGKEEAA